MMLGSVQRTNRVKEVGRYFLHWVLLTETLLYILAESDNDLGAEQYLICFQEQEFSSVLDKFDPSHHYRWSRCGQLDPTMLEVITSWRFSFFGAPLRIFQSIDSWDKDVIRQSRDGKSRLHARATPAGNPHSETLDQVDEKQTSEIKWSNTTLRSAVTAAHRVEIEPKERMTTRSWFI